MVDRWPENIVFPTPHFPRLKLKLVERSFSGKAQIASQSGPAVVVASVVSGSVVVVVVVVVVGAEISLVPFWVLKGQQVSSYIFFAHLKTQGLAFLERKTKFSFSCYFGSHDDWMISQTRNRYRFNERSLKGWNSGPAAPKSHARDIRFFFDYVYTNVPRYHVSTKNV